MTAAAAFAALTAGANAQFANLFGDQEDAASINGPEGIAFTDFDQDGDLDMIVAAYSAWVVYSVENLGGGEFGQPQALTPTSGAQYRYPAKVRVADLDGDGLNDLVVNSFVQDRVSWLRGVGGGSYGAVVDSATGLDGCLGLEAVDLDSDGDIDLVTSSVNHNEILFHENMGGANYASPSVISSASFKKSK